MIATSVANLRIVLFEGTGSRPLAATDRFALMRALLTKGFNVTSVRATVANGHVADIAAKPLAAFVVLGRFLEAKPATALSENGGGSVYFKEIDGLSADQVVEQVDGVREQLQGPKPGAWKPWFPVIDYSRCTNCMQCLSFCLFDVYGVSSEGKLQVQNQNKCKTDCPACSRVCPEVAILFPKYRHGPINGDEINSDDLRREAMKVDISALLGGDIYQALRDRSAKAKSRFSKERDDERALQERQRCLAKLQERLDVPAEVLASLPSLDQIQAKAEEAKAKAKAALELAEANGHAAPR